MSRAIRSAMPSSGSPQNSWTSASAAETASAAAEAPPKYSRGCARPAVRNGGGAQGRSRDAEVLAAERDVLLRPQPARELHELPGPGVALGLVAFRVAVRGEVVLAADDVDQQAALAQVIQRGRRAGEVGGLPVARPDRHQGLERGGAGGQRGGHGEGVGTAPAGADQRPGPAVLLDDPGQVGGPAEAGPAVRDIVAAMARLDRVRDVPEEFQAHATTLDGPAAR